MATFTVNTLEDENDYGAVTTIFNPFGPDFEIPIGLNVSLREAVKLANDSDGADTIVFADGLEGLIRLTNGEITITDEVMIDGGGVITITGDAGGDDLGADGALASASDGITDVAQSLNGEDLLDDNSRIFNRTVYDAYTTLSGLTLTGGRTTADGESANDTSQAGAAVRSFGKLKIEDSTISGNSTAGRYSSGGGIYAFEATVINSTISGNSTAGDDSSGGGVDAIEATVINSTISGNSTAGEQSPGGGIYATQATVTNSTISGNSTAGLNSLGGGIGADARLTVTNSIILGNKALQSDSDELFEYGEAGGDTIITVSGANIIGSNSDAFDTDEPLNGDGTAINASAAVVFAETTDNNGVAAGVLADNGGDVQTIALKAAPLNPALDAATIAGNDARGQARSVDLTGVNNGGTSDLGAFELQSGEDDLAPVFTSDTDISVGEGLSAGLSAFPVTATDVSGVTFSISGGPDASRVSIDGATGVLSFATEPDFENPSDDDGDNTFNVLVGAIDSGGTFALNTLNITITDVNEAPVAIASTASGEARTVVLGTLEATDVDAGDELTFTLVTDASNGEVTVNPGGTFQFEPDDGFLGTDSFTFSVSDGELSDTGSATVTVTEQRSLIVTTTADVVDNLDGLTSLREAVAYANDRMNADTITFAAGGQGLIRLTEGEIEITKALTIDGGGLVTITGDAGANDATLAGGITDVAASLDGQDLLADNSRIFNITEGSAETTLSGLTLTGGRTTAYGEAGGAVQSLGAVRVEDSTISGNSTSGDRATGGGIHANYATATNSTISGNLTSGENGDGGGVYSRNGFSSTGSTISDNSTTGYLSYGGGVTASIAMIDNSTISGNMATGGNAVGGGVSAGAAVISNSTITGNAAAEGGGGVYFSGLMQVSNSVILGNANLQTGFGDEVKGSIGNEVITVTGANIIGNNSTAFDTDAQVDLASTGAVQNAQAFRVFADTTFTNGVDAGVLGNNGGDVRTIALLEDVSNPALDAATIAGVDARGEARGADLAGVDNGGTSDLGAFELQTQPPTRPEFTSPDFVSVAENLTFVIDLQSTDAIETEGAGLTYSISSGFDDDLFAINPVTGFLTFLTAPDFEAPQDGDGDNLYELTVVVTDDEGSSAGQSLTVRVTDVNEAPVAAAASATGDEDTVISGVLAASDVDGDALSFSLVDGPSNGSVTVNANGSFQFTPVADFNGPDSFTFRASDGALSDTATANITVNPVNEPVDPVDPIDPVDPVDPVDPIDPVDPPNPTDPPGPADPTPPTGPTAGDDTLIGTALNDTIDALAGNDDVTGLAGDDLLLGRGGDDNIRGSAGDDSLRGNGGDDTLKGNGGDDNIKGNGGEDVIRGNGGDDVIRAGGGADNVKGGGGADLIFGGGGADQLNGGGGADTLRGNGGDDTLKGNGGADVFQFRASDRNDTISDFQQGQDKIQIQSGANSFAGLNIEQDGRDVLIGFGAGQVRVITDNAGAFDESDFIF